ncbi:Lysophospholipase L1 [Actinopolyspora xinjiangensis]|uniref:Lysophospholipase L1 n=1 Tax=Actinopolyspora xinjiangensis TaxID=405564 RepID=A0A1H0RMT7_9ACTN|nr:SGNH/GDSL hydrolase family protein [Actinopolyspora xinjiangensis]SDP30823.1 Lysophospholipase L1 [Actinopolyspora xinjiangensis]
MRGLVLRTLLCLLSCLAVVAATAPVAAARSAPESRSQKWVAAWAASPVRGSDLPGSDTCPAADGVDDATVRDVVFVSTGGSEVRVRLSNVFGTAPLRIGHATVAERSEGAAAVPGTVRELTFDGRSEVEIPAGRHRYSDPVGLDVEALSTLLISVHLPEATGPLTNHPFTAQTNYLAEGDTAADPSGEGYSTTPCWMVADAVDVRPDQRVRGAVVAFGDSITDTAATTGNANQRWPDHLARRLRAKEGETLSVVNAGLGGNRLLAERPGQPYYGVAGLDRFARDALSQSGVRSVIVLEGINDIGYNATAEELIAGYERLIELAHEQGVTVLGGTITPFKGSSVWNEQRERTRQRVNEWIRNSGRFDAVVDFAAATADPADPLRLRPSYDGGDGLHPGDAGTAAMAAAVDLGALLSVSSSRDAAASSARD